MNFFNKLPTITYNGNLARNIMARAKLSDATKSNSRLFFPYTLDGDKRVDVLSNQYYGNPGYTWLVWFANETIDPYYDLPLNVLDFEQYIINKYGSVELAQRKTAHYRINWRDDSAVISVNAFNNIGAGTQKYWTPLLDYNLNVQGYARKRDDQILNTNRIGTLNISSVTGTFKVGEEIQLQSDSTIYATCTYADSSTLTIQHINGIFTSGNIIFGKESGARATISLAYNYVATTAAYDDSNYWSPVSYYDYELDLNDKKKEIVLMDAMQAGRAEQELIRVMSE